MRRLALFVVVVVATACSSSHPSPRSSSTTTAGRATAAATPRQAALALAHRMLDEAVLPPGALRSRAALPKLLQIPATVPTFGNLRDVYRAFTVRGSPAAAERFVRAHLPRGFVSDSYAYVSDGRASARQAFQRLSVRPLNVSFAELEFGIAADGSGRSFVRVDAMVGWTAPRPADEFVSTRDRVVILTEFRGALPGSPTGRRAILTAPARVRPIVRAFDDLRVAPPDNRFHCPLFTSRTVSFRVAFAPSSAAAPDVIATIGPCGPITVTVNGRDAPSLTDVSARPFSIAVTRILASVK